ncbi:MAG: hypothetical protein IKL25_08730 [Clostridia bacterium]|nr:hypothetical protein [Clostridia bacterium]MBR6668428.1 hypothetical protein [Clostridia bacterium]
MMNIKVEQLETEVKRCSDGILTKEYRAMLDALDECPLTQELVDYLCSMIVSKKHFWEIHFEHLRPLLLNPTAVQFDLKSFYEERFKRSRRLCMRMYFMRGYAMYASEQETAVMCEKFERSLKNGHDYIDYTDIMSEYGMQYLVREYGYRCFQQAWQTAQEEYMKIHPYLRGHVTTNARLRYVKLLSDAESMRRHHLFLQYLQSRKKQ